MINEEFMIYWFLIVWDMIKIVIPVLIGVMYLIYAERRIIAMMQQRLGPNMVGPFGLLQPVADGVKLIFKEFIIPSSSNKFLFMLAPIITFSLALLGWAVIPFGVNENGLPSVLVDIDLGILYFLVISSFGVYGVVLAGWSSNSKYALLGSLRSAAQMISYEVGISFLLLSVLFAAGSLRVTDIVLMQQNMPVWLHIMFLPMSILFFICILAETNRHPFDLPESEAELVAGFNVEYSSTAFALFFLGEYANMILMSAMLVILFFGGWLPPSMFGLISTDYWPWIPSSFWLFSKVSIVLFCFIWVRGTLPRYRYDQLMKLGWKFFLPTSFGLFLIVTNMIFFLGRAI